MFRKRLHVIKRLSGRGWDMATFSSHSQQFCVKEKKILGAVCATFFFFLCLSVPARMSNSETTQAPFPKPPSHFSFFHLATFRRKRFFANLWCRITGLKSRVAALICHINLLTSVSAVTHNSASCDMWIMGWVYRLTLPLTQIFFISVTSNLDLLCLLHYLYCPPNTHTRSLTHSFPFWGVSRESIFWSSCHRNTIICRLSTSARDTGTALTFNVNGKNKYLTFVQLKSLHHALAPGLRGHQKSELPVLSVFCSLLSLVTWPHMHAPGALTSVAIKSECCRRGQHCLETNKRHPWCKTVIV